MTDSQIFCLRDPLAYLSPRAEKLLTQRVHLYEDPATLTRDLKRFLDGRLLEKGGTEFVDYYLRPNTSGLQLSGLFASLRPERHGFGLP